MFKINLFEKSRGKKIRLTYIVLVLILEEASMPVPKTYKGMDELACKSWRLGPNRPGSLEDMCSANQNCPYMDTYLNLRKECPGEMPVPNMDKKDMSGIRVSTTESTDHLGYMEMRIKNKAPEQLRGLL